MATPPAAGLVQALHQHSLLEPAQFDQVSRFVQTSSAAPQVLGKELVKRGWLTSYQVQLLLRGHGDHLVLGPYVLLDTLGGGGGGQVFKARHQKMNRLVALKVLRPELCRDAEAVQRFYREMEVASQLSHPNIIHAYESGPIGSSLVLVLEYVEGVDLERLVQKSGPLGASQACEYLRQAACGLAHAHERGLIHRDIKPSNLLVSGGGVSGGAVSGGAVSGGAVTGSKPASHHSPLTPHQVVKILDLGLARLRYFPINSRTANLTLAGDAAVTQGTPDYMSPEQALDFHGADIRSDLYSLGCTLYFLLAGRAPFAGGALAEKLLKHQQAAPPPLEKVRNDLPPGLTAIVYRLLAKSPADRYQTPGELVQALTDLLAKPGLRPASVPTLNDSIGSTLQITLGSGGFWEQCRVGMRRRRWALLAGAAVLLLTGGLLLAAMMARRTDEQAGATPPGSTSPAATSARRQLAPAELVTHITVSNRKVYTIATARLKELCYLDRTYTITEISPGLEGTVLIRTSCDDKHEPNQGHVQFTLALPAVVYVAFDPRATKPPAWLSDGSWHLTGETAGFTVLKAMRVFARKYPAGTVTIGGNSAPGAEATYLLFVRAEP